MFWVEQGELRARIDKPGAERLTASRFEKVADDVYRDVSGRERGELLRVTRAADGTVTKLNWATYLFTREPIAFGEHAPPAARSTLRTSTRATGVLDSPVEHGPTRVRYGEPGADHRHLTQPRVGEDLVDGAVVAAGDERERPRPEDPRRMVGRRLVGLPRLVVAPAGEALLALAAGLGPPLHVPLPDLVLDQALALRAGRRRTRPCARGALPTRPGAVAAVAKDAASAGPAYDVAKGRRATNVEPSAGLARERSVADDELGLPVARGEVLDPAPDPGRRHQDRRRRRHAQVTRAPSAQRSRPVSVELVAAVPQGEVERHGGAAEHDVRVVGRRLAHRGRRSLRHGDGPPRVGVVGQDRDRRRVVGPQA